MVPLLLLVVVCVAVVCVAVVCIAGVCVTVTCVVCPPAGQTLAASYPAAIESLPPAAEDLRGRLGGLGGAGEVGLQSLAKVAAGEVTGGASQQLR